MQYKEMMMGIEIERLRAEIMVRNHELNFLRYGVMELIGCLDEQTDGGDPAIRFIASKSDVQVYFNDLLRELIAYIKNLPGDPK